MNSFMGTAFAYVGLRSAAVFMLRFYAPQWFYFFEIPRCEIAPSDNELTS
ncbi:hypothetical protein CLV65_1400 [Pseudoscardovia suis]|nr:hypothetical protein CLV65_1400 [Pseudoscardovia suis]